MLTRAKIVNLLCLLGLVSYSYSVLANPPIPWGKLQALEGTEYVLIEHRPSNKETQQHHIFIKLPTEYASEQERSFPTLYLLDGGTNFPLFAAYYDYLRWMEDIPPMIIVGLSYGTHDWQKGNNRSHDFTAPSKDKDHYGGASAFDSFLRTTLMPKIESLYRVERNKQVLFGQSLAGQFALFTSMYGKSPFYGVIASNPAIHGNLAFFKQALSDRTDRPKLIITVAEFDDDRFKIPFNQWHQHWQNKKVDWQYQLLALSHHNHLSATPESIRQGLQRLFPPIDKEHFP